MSRLLTTLGLTSATLIAAFTLAACSGEPKDTHPDQLVTKRRAAFKELTKSLEPMGMVARERKDYTPREFHINALELQKLSEKPWPYFTADSNYPPTHAMPEVWSKAAEFKQATDQYLGTVRQLVKAAEGGDVVAVRAAVNEVQKSCKSCHTTFRNDK